MQWFRTSKPVEELFYVKNDPYSMNNLADDNHYQEVLQKMRKKHMRWMLETKDIGLFPEDIQTEMEERYGMTMLEIMRNYDIPLEKIIHINQLWTKGEKSTTALQEALSDTLAANRYHAAIGLGDLKVGDNKSENLITRMLKNEEHPSVKRAAAYALFQMGNEQQATPILNEGLQEGLQDNEAGYIVLSLIRRLGEDAKDFKKNIETTFEKQKKLTNGAITQDWRA